MILPEALYTAAEVRELDRLAIEQHRISGATLMQRAGTAAFDLLRARWPRARRVAVVCGPGNNGGDGYVIAQLAHVAGLHVMALSLGEPEQSKGDAAAACKRSRRAGVSLKPFHADALRDRDVVVDALLGTGLARAVEGEARVAIEAINEARKPVLAVDIPSGLHSDTGRVLGAAVRAHATISFIGLKAGLYTGVGREHAGEIYFDDLGVPSALYEKFPPLIGRLTESLVYGLLPARRRDAHKGESGTVLVVGGDRGMPGAVRLAGEAAYRAGAGLVLVATHPDHAAAIAAARPELIVHGVATAEQLRPLLARADVVAVGPGLGRGDWGETLFGAALDASIPMVVDADALNALAADPLMRPDWMLTPHPGEAGRLLGLSSTEVQADRFTAVREIVASYGGVCVLKGSGTLIASLNSKERRADVASKTSLADGMISVCDRGNPGMASAGVGDVLTGVIAGLRAQGLAPLDAARLGVWVHAAAGDDAVAAGGDVGLLASDLFGFIRARLNRLVDRGAH